jgi:uncharacterized protein YkwD
MHRKLYRASPRPVRACVAGLVFTFVMVSAVPPARAKTDAKQEIHAMINEARAESGLARLNQSDQLSRIARRHSKEMASYGGLFHSSCLTCQIEGGRILGENVGFGADAQVVQEAMMESPPHRAIILGRWRRVGVGIVRQGGLTWVTEIFFS